MLLILRIIIAVSALAVALYPLWGIIWPESYRTELLEDFAGIEQAPISAIKQASAWLWLANAVFAASLAFILRYLAKDNSETNLKWASTCLIIHPFLTLASDLGVYFSLAKYSTNTSMAIELSSTTLMPLLFGCCLLAIHQKLKSHLPTFD